MEVTRQKPTLPAAPSGVKPTLVSAEQPLKWQWQHYIDWCATGGLRLTEDGQLIDLSATALAEELKVNRTTLYDWPKIIPNFQERVAKRQRDIYGAGSARANNVWKGLLLRALRGDAKQAEMVLSHFAGYTPPAQKHEVEAGNNLTDLLMLAMQRRSAIEGQLVTPPGIAEPVEEGQLATDPSA